MSCIKTSGVFKGLISVGAIAAVLALATVVPSMAAATYAPGDPFVLTINQGVGVHNIYFQDQSGSHGNGGGGNHSYLIDSDQYSRESGRMSTDPTCASLDDPKCSSVSLFKWNSALPFCTSASDMNCLSLFGSVNADGSLTSASFIKNFPLKAQNAYTGDLNKKLPSGGTSEQFTLAAPNGTTVTYLVTAFLSGMYRKGEATTSVNGFNLEVVPVKITDAANPGPCTVNTTGKGFTGTPCTDDGFQKIYRSTTDQTQFFWGEGGGQGAQCSNNGEQLAAIANFEKLCAHQIAFPTNQKFYVRLRLNAAPSGWMHGRLTDPLVTINKVDGGNEYLFEGSPVLVPVLYKDYFWKDIPPSIQAHYDPTNGHYDGSSCDGFTTGKIVTAEEFKNPLIRNYTEKPCASGTVGINELNTWLPEFNNTATATPSVWNVRTISAQETEGANKCFSDPNMITGIVTTNSTEYSSGPPAFSKTTGTLDYQVASPHYMQDGSTPFKGVYNLVMRSDVARCIYNFSKAPVKATVSVINSSGSPEVASVIVGEKDGWLYLSANNFEFSSPTVQIKLMQDESAPVASASASPAASASATPVASVKTNSKSTITCIKGKLTKSVTGIKPTCPSGYKKK